MKYKRKKDKDFWQMARAYLHDFMPAVRNQSDKSVAAYKQSLNSYLSFLESEKGLKEGLVTFETFNRSNVKDFVEWLRERKYAPKTINLKLTAIRSFLDTVQMRTLNSEVSIMMFVPLEKSRKRKSQSNICSRKQRKRYWHHMKPKQQSIAGTV